MSTSSRRGFTLVELLIVIAIIGVLMALLLPAVQAARERSRQAVCTNNQSQLAKAMISFATEGKGNFPGWAQDQKLGLNANLPENVDSIPVTWAAKLLPRLDQKGLWDQLLDSDSFDYNNPPKLDIFLCPSDARTNPKVGALTYVVNSGLPDPMVDILPTGTVSDLKANGICHDLRSGRNGPTVRYGADIKDGMGTTLLFSENVHKEEIAFNSTLSSTWMGPVQVNLAGPVSMNTNPEQRFGFAWVYDINSPNLPKKELQQRINRDLRDTPNPYDFHDGQTGSQFMRPASAHPEVFVVAFCGGSIKSLNENIEFRVYQQLMTPNGAKAAVQRTPNVKLTNFMTPPLSESDY